MRLGLLAIAAAAATVGLFLGLVGLGHGASQTSTGSPADASLLASIMSQASSANLSSATVGNPPADTVASASAPKWLYFDHNSGESSAQDALDRWQASIIAGAYAAQCDSQGADCIAGYTLTTSDGPAQARDGDQAIGFTSVPRTSASSSDIESWIDSRLGSEGLTPASVTFEHPYGLAPIIAIDSSDPESTLKEFDPGFVFAGLDLDGAFVQMVDGAGSVFYAIGFSSRAQEAGGWIDPNLNLPRQSGLFSPNSN